MRFVAHHQVPTAVRRSQLVLYVLVAGKFIQAGNDQIGFLEPVAGARAFQLVIGEDFER